MDQELRLRNHASAIDPATDFTYKWGLNVGLSETKAQRLALAVDEIVTDVVRFAYPGEEETFQIAFRSDLSTAEEIVTFARSCRPLLDFVWEVEAEAQTNWKT